MEYKKIIETTVFMAALGTASYVAYYYNVHAEGIARYIRMKAKKMFGLEKKINEPTQSKQ